MASILPLLPVLISALTLDRPEPWPDHHQAGLPLGQDSFLVPKSAKSIAFTLSLTVADNLTLPRCLFQEHYQPQATPPTTSLLWRSPPTSLSDTG